MRRLILLFASLLLCAPAAAQRPEPEWRQAVEEQVLVRLSAFEPNEIKLEAGRPTRLVFFNNTRGRLSFQAGGFFANSYIRRGDERLVSGGGMMLEPGETRAVTLVPTEGRYRMRSRSWFRRLVGMSAVIVVEPAGTRQRAQGRIAN
jgi:urease beta subunit